MRERTFRRRIAGLAWLCLPGVLGAQSQRAVLIRTDRATADSSWSAGFRATVAAAAVPDAVLLWPGAPVVRGVPDIGRLLMVVQGVANLVRPLAADAKPDSLRVTWQPLGAELSSDSTLGATWGVTVAASAGSDAPVIGRYIAAWRREAIGTATTWRLAAIMFTDITSDVTAPRVAELPLELPPLKLAGGTEPFVASDLAFARLAGDSGAGIAFERWAAPDAHTFVGGGLLVQGPAAIGRAVSGSATWKWHPVVAGASVDGSMGWTVGEAVITAADGHSGPSKYLTVWKRQADGSIRFVTDGGNGRPVAR